MQLIRVQPEFSKLIFLFLRQGLAFFELFHQHSPFSESIEILLIINYRLIRYPEEIILSFLHSTQRIIRLRKPDEATHLCHVVHLNAAWQRGQFLGDSTLARHLYCVLSAHSCTCTSSSSTRFFMSAFSKICFNSFLFIIPPHTLQSIFFALTIILRFFFIESRFIFSLFSPQY
jgi:hypothetical protein